MRNTGKLFIAALAIGIVGAMGALADPPVVSVAGGLAPSAANTNAALPVTPSGPHFTIKIASIQVHNVEPQYTSVTVQCIIGNSGISSEGNNAWPPYMGIGYSNKFPITNGAFSSGPISIPITVKPGEDPKKVTNWECRLFLSGPGVKRFDPSPSNSKIVPGEFKIRTGAITQ